MKRVFKYSLAFEDINILEMPVGAEILCAQTQRDTPCIWALVDPFAPRTKRRFRVAGTGHPIEDAIKAYIGTVQIDGGSLVFHVFEVIRPATEVC
jgi:hypothetical protein